MSETSGYRVLVCGGRHYADREKVAARLSNLHASVGVAAVIEGGAAGADRHGREWAERNGVPVETYAADWNRYGRAAGPIRNGQMLLHGKPDVVLAFPGGDGTADMVRRARLYHVNVIEVPNVSRAGAGTGETTEADRE
jgi:hypothetical protein